MVERFSYQVMEEAHLTIKELIDIQMYDVSLESRFGSVEVLAYFDHDYQGSHFLVQQWDRFADTPEWIYALYLREYTTDRDSVTLVKQWPSGSWAAGLIPFAEAGELVQQWRRSQR